MIYFVQYTSFWIYILSVRPLSSIAPVRRTLGPSRWTYHPLASSSTMDRKDDFVLGSSLNKSGIS